MNRWSLAQLLAVGITLATAALALSGQPPISRLLRRFLRSPNTNDDMPTHVSLKANVHLTEYFFFQHDPHKVLAGRRIRGKGGIQECSYARHSNSGQLLLGKIS